jgi:hypothetical protein
MAPRPTSREPAWTFGNGRGMEARQGAIRIFRGDADGSPERAGTSHPRHLLRDP